MPIEVIERINTDDLQEITDQVQMQAFIYTYPKSGEKRVILRVYKDGVFEGAGLELSPDISEYVLKYFDENGKLICSK
jgi:hypothetical protein